VDNVCDSFTTTVDSNGNTTLTCVPISTTPPPVGAPTGCVATINGTTLTTVSLTSAGGQATLLVSCASPTSGITYNWSKNGVLGASSSSQFNETFPANTTTIPITTSYQVKACVNTACVTVPTNPLTVTVAAGGGGGGGGGGNPPPPNGWNGSCNGFNKTVVLDLNWAAPSRVSSGGFGPNDVIVARFTTGNLDSASNNLPRLSGAEFGSPPSARFAVLSDTPCDFSPAQKQQGAVSAGNSVQVPFAVGLGNNWGFYPILQKNTTYYFNVKNLSPTESCSNQGICDMFIELSKPSGL
jgi:hypothetical protein